MIQDKWTVQRGTDKRYCFASDFFEHRTAYPAPRYNHRQDRARLSQFDVVTFSSSQVAPDYASVGASPEGCTQQ